MRKDLNTLEQIDLYLMGQVSGEELMTFETEIENNPELKETIQQQKLLIQAIKRQALSKQINAVAKGGSFINFKWILGGVILLLVLSLGYWKLNSQSTAKNIKQSKTVKPLEVKKDNKPSTNADLIVKKEAENEIKYSSTNKKTKQKSNVQPPPTDTPNTFDFYDFNGLKCWEKPNIQTFEINANETSTIEGENGTLIIIPKNALQTKNGKTVSGKVKFELIEAYDLSDMIFYNLTTTANQNVLETGGMFYTNATQNGEPLQVNPNQPMVIQVPCEEEKPNMMAFESEITTEGGINWKNPKPLEKWLTKIDLNLIDFLPDGFEDEIYANMPIMGYQKANDTVVYNTYYYLGYERVYLEPEKSRKNKIFPERLIGIGKQIEEGEKFTLKPIDSIKCSIHPLAIKTIKENDNFANSFIATKEFEERLKVLHKADKGQQFLDIYLANLDKNLWYSDSIVASKITSNKKVEATAKDQSLKNRFTDFYNQRKTKVKNGDEYALALSKYYNTKRADYKKEAERIKNKKAQILALEQAKLKRLAKPTAKSNVSRVNNYTVQWYQFGWTNIDSYLHLLEKGSEDIEVSCEKANPKGRIKMYQWLGAISALTPILVNQLKGIVKVPKKGSKGWLKMQNVYALGLANENGNWFYGVKKYNPYKTPKIDIEFTPISYQLLKEQLKQLKGANPLIKDLENQIKALEKLRKQKLKVELEKKNEYIFINKLKTICFPCNSNKSSEGIKLLNDNVIVAFQSEPSFPGGQDALQQFIMTNYRIPEECIKPFQKKIKIYVKFTVKKDGTITNPTIEKGINECLNNEAIRVVKLMPKWQPAYQNGKPISLEYIIPITIAY